MSAAAVAGRIAVFAAFAALAGAGALALRPAPPAAAPSEKELAGLEASFASRARLHPLPPSREPLGSTPFCAECHPAAAPHPGRRVADAVTNDHAGRMDCLVCHWTAAALGPRPAPAWLVPSGAPAFLAVLPADRSGRESLAALRAKAAVGRPCFERGLRCDGCHRPGGMSGLVRPGDSGVRAAALERLENYFTLAPGEKWYFPQFQ